MKFLLDHDVPTEVARVLSQGGHEVVELRNVLPRDTADAEVLRYARLQPPKDQAQLDGWLRDGSSAYVEGLCEWQ